MQGIFDNPLAAPGLLCVANNDGMTLTLAVLLGGGRLPVWMLGFSGVDWRDKWLMLPLLPFLAWLCTCGRVINLLALGDVAARQLGLPVYFWRPGFVLAGVRLDGRDQRRAGRRRLRNTTRQQGEE